MEMAAGILIFYLIPLSLSLLFSLRLPVWYLRPWLKLKLAAKTSMLQKLELLPNHYLFEVKDS